MADETAWEELDFLVVSPDEIRARSSGEVTTTEFINYSTGQFVHGGLFCERIFGPEADDACRCGRLAGPADRGKRCSRCGVECCSSSVRSHRMGHIQLAVPICNTRFSRSVHNPIHALLGLEPEDVKQILACRRYVITYVDLERMERTLSVMQGWLAGIDKPQPCHELTSSEISDAIGMLQTLHAGSWIDEDPFLQLDAVCGCASDSQDKEGHPLFLGATGGEALYELLVDINLDRRANEMRAAMAGDLPDSNQRLHCLRIVEAFRSAHCQPVWNILDVLPVLPPALRPLVRRDDRKIAIHPLNDRYRRVIHRNERLRKLMLISPPETVINHEKRLLQEAVDAVLDYDVMH